MAASDKKLGVLHEQVAEALTEQVIGFDEPIFDAEGTEVAVRKVRPSPALLGAAIAFLKNNNITADVGTNSALQALNEKLRQRRSKKLSQADLDVAAEQFAARFGDQPSTLQ